MRPSASRNLTWTRSLGHSRHRHEGTLAKERNRRKKMTTAIIGIGNIGGIVARDLATGGEHVVLSAGNVDDVKKLAAEIGSLATAAEANRDAVERADNWVVAPLLDAVKVVIPEGADPFRGKIGIDTSKTLPVGVE